MADQPPSKLRQPRGILSSKPSNFCISNRPISLVYLTTIRRIGAITWTQWAIASASNQIISVRQVTLTIWSQIGRLNRFSRKYLTSTSVNNPEKIVLNHFHSRLPQSLLLTLPLSQLPPQTWWNNNARRIGQNLISYSSSWLNQNLKSPARVFRKTTLISNADEGFLSIRQNWQNWRNARLKRREILRP